MNKTYDYDYQHPTPDPESDWLLAQASAMLAQIAWEELAVGQE